MNTGKPRSIIHVDMDAFYASVEQRDRPELRNRPVIVGGHAQRGVVLAASYEVRPFGVRSAMPMAQAVRQAPHAVVVPPRFDAYAAASQQVFAIFSQFTPLVEPLSLDEAFLDVTASSSLFGAAARIAYEIRARIDRQVNLPASAGIASAKLIAKIASDLAKPNGQREVPPDGVGAFLAPLPVGRLWGVGRKTEDLLRAMGLRTIGDVAAADPVWLERRLSGGRELWDLAHGRDDRPVIPDRDAKSVGAEDTFGEDLEGVPALQPHVHGQALRVGERLRRSGLRARVVQLKLKSSDFTLITRRTTLPEPTDDGQTLYRAALRLLEEHGQGRRMRLSGVAAHELARAERQMALFARPPSRSHRLNAAMDAINARFGPAAITTADLCDDDAND